MTLIYGTHVTTISVDIEQDLRSAYAVMRAEVVMAARAGYEILPGPPERVTHTEKSGREVAHYRWPIAREVQSW